MRHLLLAVCLLTTAGCSARGSQTVTQVRTKTVPVYVSTDRASAGHRAPEPSTVPVPIDDRTAPLSQLIPADARIQRCRFASRADAGRAGRLATQLRSGTAVHGDRGRALESTRHRHDRNLAPRLLPPRNRAEGVERMDVDSADLTGDGRDDFLVFEDMDGSGGCGLYRVYRAAAAAATEIWRRHACTDWKSTFCRATSW